MAAEALFRNVGDVEISPGLGWKRNKDAEHDQWDVGHGRLRDCRPISNTRRIKGPMVDR